MVNGLFYQDATQQQLCKGIEGLFAGEYWLSRQLVADYLYRTRKKPKPKMPMKAELTKREVQILQLTATGATNTEIAEQLNVSMHTVKTHIYNLFKKIGVARSEERRVGKECRWRRSREHEKRNRKMERC